MPTDPRSIADIARRARTARTEYVRSQVRGTPYHDRVRILKLLEMEDLIARSLAGASLEWWDSKNLLTWREDHPVEALAIQFELERGRPPTEAEIQALAAMPPRWREEEEGKEREEEAARQRRLRAEWEADRQAWQELGGLP